MDFASVPAIWPVLFNIFIYNGSVFSHTQLLSKHITARRCCMYRRKRCVRQCVPDRFQPFRYLECKFRLRTNGVFFFLFLLHRKWCTLYMYHLIRWKFLGWFVFRSIDFFFILNDWVCVCVCVTGGFFSFFSGGFSLHPNCNLHDTRSRIDMNDCSMW